MGTDFTERQLAAIDIDKAGQDTCVVAGPGSGKTMVLVERYRRLVVEAGVSPRRMLAITFTEKAARNMKERLAESFREQPEHRRELEQASVSTIHGFCAKLLRENSVFAGIDPEFRVLDNRQAIIMQQQAASDALDRMFAAQPDAMRRLMHGLSSPDLAGTIPDVYDAMRCAGLSPDELRRFPIPGAAGVDQLRDALNELATENRVGWTPSHLAKLQEVIGAALRITALPDAPLTDEHFRALAAFPTSLVGLKRSTGIYTRLKEIKDTLIPAIYRTLLTAYYGRETLVGVLEHFDGLYSERKRQVGALDYSDLESFTVRLLAENAGLRERVRADFQHVLMDEFQDTNGQQAKLLDLLRGPDRFYAVGDINQSIYGFRHADPEVFREYRDTVERDGKHVVELVENWRSRVDILRAVETILANARGIVPRALAAAKGFPEKLEASVEVLAAIAETQEAALELEARLVARRILEMAGELQLARRPAHFGDIAVLVRNTEVLPAFTRAFEEAGIPYLLNQGKGFFETREVLDLTHLLRAIANPRDEISLAAVLRSPFAGVSDEALLHLEQEGSLPGAIRRLEHLGAAFGAEDREKLRGFREQWLRWRESGDAAGFDRLLTRAMYETGYAAEPGSRAAANIEKFLALAREASTRITLAEFVDELDLMRAADARDVDAPPEDAVSAVRIMTVHAAKGLEFPVVFLAALHKGIQQGVGQLAFSPRLGLGASWVNPVTGDTKRDCFLKAIEDQSHDREIEEGNRLFYVAMTRAEEHLVFSLSSFGKRKEWAATLEAALGVDFSVPHNKIQRVATPAGESFLLRLLVTNAAPERLARVTRDSSTAAVERLARPTLRDQHDSSASVTAVAQFADCPRRYYLERYLGWRGNRPRNLRVVEEEDDESDEVDADEIDASEFGVQVHQLLAGQEVRDAAPEALRLAESFHASALGVRAARAGRVEREFDFLMSVEDVVLRGQIDLWFEEGGELIVIDYKTDEVTARDAAARAEFYAPQLRLYALALERIAGRFPDKAFVCFLRPGVALPVSLENTLLDNPESLVRDFREAQSTLHFPLREDEHCGRCPFFKGLCPAGSAVVDVVGSSSIHGEDLAGDEIGAG